MARKTERVERLKGFGRASAQVAVVATRWTGERVQDASMWPVNLIRDLPLRAARLAVTVWRGVRGLIEALPGSVRALSRGGPSGLAAWSGRAVLCAGAWFGRLAMQVVDLAGVPELFSFLWRAMTHSSALTGAEIAALAAVLGPTALRYRDVRVAEGGILRPVFVLNKGRAFTTFHTVNLPSSGEHRRDNLEILLHEMVHVYQHERVGGVYMGECIHAQATDGYDYDGTAGLRQARAKGNCYRDFNREQQAQIVQDYFVYLRHGWDTSDFGPFIEEMSRGQM